MKIFSSIHEFRLLTFLLSLALLLGVCTLTITEADAKGNNKKEISAEIDFMVESVKVFGNGVNRRAYGQIWFTGPSSDGKLYVEGSGNAFFDVSSPIEVATSIIRVKATVLVDSLNRVHKMDVVGIVSELQISARDEGTGEVRWLQGRGHMQFYTCDFGGGLLGVVGAGTSSFLMKDVPTAAN